jgi:hypothetical protein
MFFNSEILNIDQLFEHIGFPKPSTFAELLGFYEVYKENVADIKFNFDEILHFCSITPKKRQAMKDRIEGRKKFTASEIRMSVAYAKSYNTEIKAILHPFTV